MMNKENQKVCTACGKLLAGRSDKKFCDPYCKSSYHYKKSIEELPKFYKKVDSQLKTNRKILKKYNKAGKATLRAEVLIKEGFNAKYFTHYWKNTKGDVYLFVYEYGFLTKKENNNDKFILIKWQPYMEKH